MITKKIKRLRTAIVVDFIFSLHFFDRMTFGVWDICKMCSPENKPLVQVKTEVNSEFESESVCPGACVEKVIS